MKIDIAITELNEINKTDIKYLLLNRELSFIDTSTLRMIEKKISNVIQHLVSTQQISTQTIPCCSCKTEFNINHADENHWEYCPCCGETFL